MSQPRPSAGLRRVQDLYDAMHADLHFVAEAPASEPAFSASVGAALCLEARLLDSRQFERWLGLWDDDAVVWVPLNPNVSPGADQSLFLDDRRRLGERVWRMRDPSAWALQPPGHTVRGVAGVEAWPLSGGEAIAASVLSLEHVRGSAKFAASARQVHRLRQSQDGWRFHRKTLLLPAHAIGTPHLGWLL